jgi:putative transcriptional regulator
MVARHIECWLIGAALAIWTSSAPAAQAQLANGVFLVAKPELQDPNFRETVVLITVPQAGGAPLGVIINRPLPARLSEIVPGAAKLPEQTDAIYAGGPVRRERVLFLVRSPERPEHSLQVLEDVYLSGNRDLLEQLARGEVKVPAFRAYAGYAGWAPGQLQAEIARGGWLVTQAEAAIIFSGDPARVWGELIKRLTARKALAPPPSIAPLAAHTH